MMKKRAGYMEDFEKQFNEELVKRIDEIESTDYEFPKRLNKFDYLLILFVVVFCLIGIIWGAFV